jgi:oligopeptide transport system permease protein
LANDPFCAKKEEIKKMQKLQYIIKRIVLALITGFIIISLTFILLKLIPGEKPLGIESQMVAFYENQVKLGYYFDSKVAIDGMTLQWKYTDSTAVTHYYYTRPVMEQYFNWLSNVFTRFDWGTSSSIEKGTEVIYVISSRLPTTIAINAITIVIAIPIGVAIGILAALKKNKPTDRVISITSMILISIPSFVFVSLLIMVFGYLAGWLPTRWPQSGEPLANQVKGYIIPVLAGLFGYICSYQRIVRGELTEVMASDFLLLARTKGLTRTQTVTHHALRNAMVPVLPSILASIVGILSGSAILESIYSIPGIGNLFVQAINQKDYNVLMLDMSVFTAIGLLSGIVLDLSYGFLDPRIRMGER